MTELKNKDIIFIYLFELQKEGLDVSYRGGIIIRNIAANILDKGNIKRNIIPIAAIFTAIVISIVVIVITRKTITVNIDGKVQKIVTYRSTVGRALESNKISIGKKDRISPSLDAKAVEGGSITIKRAVNVKLALEGREDDVLSSEDDVEALLKAEGITLKPDDKVKPEKETKLSEGMQIRIVRVETRTLTEAVSVDFSTIVKNDRDLANTKKRIQQEGRNGEKQITFSVVYEDGQEVSRTALKEIITKKPVEKIIVQGTYPLMPISRGGDAVSYNRVFKARATAYWAVRGIGKTYTASGRKAVRDPDGYSTIAVDPSVIPYGTKLFVEGYGFAIAADTGTAIIGNTIDVFFDTYGEACSWAVKYVNVYVLK